jgi:hypothetical protein
MDTIVRLAMWSGPRNISTAMMRAWGNRDDCFVVDEPFYAHYLAVTGKTHPAAAEVIAAGETDAGKVADWLTGPVPEVKRVFFQKHMAQHLLPTMDRGWIGRVENCFLIRHPRDVILSFSKIVADAAAVDTGFPGQLAIFEHVKRLTGRTPPVVDARDVQNEPRRVLGALCDRLGVDFQESMLSWPPGLRPSDGVWAPHWYKDVESSTSFRPYQSRVGELPASMTAAYEECLACYETLHRERIR